MASRIQLKRSSILGRRPSGQYLEPGELALNTNQADPGLFFETNSGGIAKVGPAHIGVKPPVSDVGYGPGEQWLDSGNGTYNIWVPALSKWVPVQSPLFGGATTAIFVGSEFPEASDDLSNDGIARPFATLNRAMLEIARRSILAGRADDLYNGRFTILLLPGRNVVYNEPGVTLGEFEQLVSGFQEDQPITQGLLRLFNGPDGGLLVPRGTSIIALDLRKTEVRPTYYPFWSRTLYEVDPTLIEARSAVLKWTGNSYLTSFTFRDKVEQVSVTRILGDPDDPAILRSVRPHGFRALVTSTSASNEVLAADRVTLTYPQGVSQLYDGLPVVSAGEYYADPINAFDFRLRTVTDASILSRRDLPQYGTQNANPPEFATLTYNLTSHHRLTALEFATLPELNVYYSKAQRAFSLLTFAGTVNNAEVARGETTIVASTPPTPEYGVDSVDNGSPYVFNCSLRSDWGMCAADVDGARVSGFKSALFCNFTSVSLQNDAEVYEVYDSVAQTWISLKQAYANTQYPVPELNEVTNAQAMGYLISPAVKVENIRYFYRPGDDIPGEDGKSSGLPSQLSDTRNYAVLCQNGGFTQIVSSFAIGVAVNYWAKSGGQISVTNANSNFGGIALRAEGFAGIGTTGGAEPADTGFVVNGIRRPSVVTRQMVEDPANIRRVYANARISSTSATTLTLDTRLDETDFLPFTLRAGTYIWVEDYGTGATYKAQLATIGAVVSNAGLTINVVDGTNDIHTAVQGGVSVDDLSLPFLRRFVDPRPAVDRVYSLWVSNTSSAHRPPEPGAILRFSEKPPAGFANLLKTGAQLDPGQSGGWGHVFQVVDSRTKAEGDNPNGSEPLIVPAQSASNYYVTLLGVDQFRPWIEQGTNGFETSPTTIDYPRGFYATYTDRAFYAAKNDEAANKTNPSPGPSPWVPAKSFEYCQPIDQAWQCAETVTVEDPFFGSYPGDACYPRGLQYDRATPAFNLVVDTDDGTNTLGVLNTTGNTDLADPDLYDPWWHPTKAAMTRFLALLGFDYNTIDGLLQPQFWTSRNLAASSMPALSTSGYALATGQWPVDFNRPSTIRCGNHTWEWSGYINYAKGLQQYQDSQLSLRERFDAMITEIWGGVVYSTGTDERGEFSITGKAVAGSTGETLLRVDDAVQRFPSQGTSYA